MEFGQHKAVVSSLDIFASGLRTISVPILFQFTDLSSLQE